MNASASARSASRSARFSTATGVDLDDDEAVEATSRPAARAARRTAGPRGPGTRCSSRLVPDAVGDVHVREPVAHGVGHRHRVRPRHRGVRQVEREVPVVLVDDVPVRAVRRDLTAAGPEREHVLDGEPDVGLAGHPLDAADEVAGVLALPAERRVYDDRLGAELLSDRAGAHELRPRIGAPDPLRDQQAGRVDGDDRRPGGSRRAGATPPDPG